MWIATRRGIKQVIVAGAVSVTLLMAAPASFAAELEEPYSSKEAGHPVKIVYYITYPVGFVLDALILKPAYWLGKHEPFRSVFGTRQTRR